MVTKKFQEMANRQKTEGFLEAESRKVEEARKLTQGQKRQKREEVAQLRKENLEKLALDEEKKAKYGTYIDNINNYEGNEFDTAIYAFVNHPDFPVIYNQLETISSARDKWGFLLRRAYEVGQEVEVFIGHNFQEDHVKAKKELANYGINLLCPYFKSTDRDKHPKDDCVIDGEPIMTMCGGDYDICNVFIDRSGKAALGQITLPEVEKTKPKINIPKINVEPVDLEDLEDWWQGEGRYS